MGGGGDWWLVLYMKLLKSTHIIMVLDLKRTRSPMKRAIPVQQVDEALKPKSYRLDINTCPVSTLNYNPEPPPKKKKTP